MPKPDPVTAVCASCGAQKPVYQLGRYDDTDRAFCLQREGKGGVCWKNRAVLLPPSSIEAIVLAARTKGSTHVHS